MVHGSNITDTVITIYFHEIIYVIILVFIGSDSLTPL